MSNEGKEGYKEVQLIGEIIEVPEKWEVEELNDHIDVLSGSSFDSNLFNNEKKGLPLIRIRNLQESNIDTYYSGEYDEKYIITNGDILIGMDGNFYVVKWNSKDALLNQRVCRVEASDDLLDQNYLYYRIQPEIKKIHRITPATTVKHLSVKDVRAIRIPVPPLPEQKKIADILSSVDQAIEKTEEIVAKTKELKQGLMQELLTKGIGHDEFKEVRIGVKEYEIPINWDVVQLEDCCEICYGKAQDDVEDKNGRYPILGTGGRIGWANDYLFDEASVLIGRKGTIDEPKFIDEPFWTIDTLFYTEVCDGVIPKWLYYYLDYYDLTLLNEATGVPSLNRKNLYNLDLPFPSLEEQKKIANILSSVDNKIQKKQEQKEKLEELKKGLMQKLLTGEVRVDV